MLKFLPASESRQLQPRGSFCQQLVELWLPFKHSRHSFHFHFCSSSPKLLPFLPSSPSLPPGSSEVSSSCQRWPGSVFRLFTFENSTFLIWKTTHGTSASVKGSICQVSATKKFSWRFKIQSQTPLVITKALVLRTGLWPALVNCWKKFGGIFYTKCEAPDCFSITQTWKFLYFCTLPNIGGTSWVLNNDISKTMGVVLSFYFYCFTILIFLSQPNLYLQLKVPTNGPFPGVLITNICMWQMRQVWLEEFRLESPVHFGEIPDPPWRPPLRRGGGRVCRHRCPSVGLVAIGPQWCLQAKCGTVEEIVDRRRLWDVAVQIILTTL